jgi:ribonuclease HI
MKRFFAVRKGYTTGIFTNYETARQAILGYPGAEHRGFNVRIEAEEWLGLPGSKDTFDVIEYLPEELSVDSDKDTLIAYVDGAYCKEITTEAYGAGIVLIHPNNYKETFSLIGHEAVEMHNTAGELCSAMYAMKKAKDNGYKKLKLHYDYVGIKNWLDGSWRTKNKYTKKYYNYYKEYIEPFIEIEFFKVKSHSKDHYNDEADFLAKRALLNL